MKGFKKFLRVFLTIVCSIIVLWIVIGLFPAPKATKTNEWLDYRNSLGRPLVSAHRGGAEINPENTEMAFDYIVENKLADIIEFDIKVTKDKKLVIIHDHTINDLVFDEGHEDVYVNDLTYDEMLQYNFGRNFEDREGNKPYLNLSLAEAKELGLGIMTLEEFLIKYEKYDIKILIEIKDSEKLAEYAADETIKLLDKYSSWKKDSMIISFTDSVINYIIKKYPDQLVGALGYNIIPELATHVLNLKALYKAKYQSIQTKMVNKAGPISINCATKEFVDQAHERNQVVAYWTIDDEEDMDTLIKIGADIITTDNPDILSKKLGIK